MIDPVRLTAEQREQLADAHLLIQAAAHNAGIAARSRGTLDAEQIQALANAASQAAQAAGGLRRVARAVRS